MAQPTPETVHKAILEELRVSSCLGSALTRAGGVCTFLALLAWLYGGLWANQWITKRVIMHKFNMMTQHAMELQHSGEDPAGPKLESQVPDPDPATVEITDEPGGSPAAGVAENSAQGLRMVDRRLNYNQLFNHYATIQGLVMVSWMVVTILTGVFMLCASVAGLAGSVRSRSWHRQVVYWTLLATASTTAGLLVLARWGGFPPIEDPWILARIAALQSSYGLAVMLALLVFRPPRHKGAAPIQN